MASEFRPLRVKLDVSPQVFTHPSNSAGQSQCTDRRLVALAGKFVAIAGGAVLVR